VNLSGEEWSIREFRALHAAINQRSITAAAAWLGISQPATSRTIANLETKVGFRLFERSGRSVLPTAEAIALNERLLPFFSLLDDMRAERNDSVSGQRLRISAPPAFANGYLQRVIASFLRIHPEIAVELDVRSSPVIIGEIADGSIELGISDMAIETRNVTRRPICSSSMACFMPMDHRLADRAMIDPADLAGEHIIALSRRHFARQQLDQMLAVAGVDQPVRIETSTTLSALAFVRQGLGIALMNPFPVALGLDPSLRAVPLDRDIQYATSFVLSPTANCPKRNG
jgi:DNA-binding transcriptional LysR family regulator